MGSDASHNFLSHQTLPEFTILPPFPPNPTPPSQVNPTPTLGILVNSFPKMKTYISDSIYIHLRSMESAEALHYLYHSYHGLSYSMDGERKKRKMEEEVEDEEKSVEKFFELIRSTREVRELMSHGDSSKQKEKKIVGKEEEEKAVKAWTPMFQPEDFMEGSQTKGDKDFPGNQTGPSERKEEEKEKSKEENGEGNGLDLNLSL